MKGYEVKNMVDMNEIENFLAEVEAQAGSKTTPKVYQQGQTRCCN